MSNLRFQALDLLQKRDPVNVEPPSNMVSDFFGESVFSMDVMKERLSAKIFKKVQRSIEKGLKIDVEIADTVAAAAKAWAVEKGVTHFAHWFQPLTGSTAEKHDTFYHAPDGVERFSGSALVQQEPDGSSFPNGGIRSTFEARGYTAWDPTSPMFIWDTTLCIPTIFVSFTGEALDYKTHLLKSIEMIDKASTNVCKLFDRNVTSVKASLGCEQEYFVVDKALYAARPDLVMSGRTVFGHSPARGQQLEDHYFGSIPTRVQAFMKDFEVECWKLGIPVSTRHNEVAPSQFEVAPVYEELNVATDHNQLMMDVMGKVAERHHLKVLFHEKPFAGLNGSGKHNNWSLVTSTGINVFQPSGSARENLLFLTFLVNTIKAVYDRADLLRASIASAGNDYRLGANEAPPAIMSVFIGSQLSAVLDELEENGHVNVEKGDNLYMKLGIDKIPEIMLDNTDRNRTSPFAFTGNKFEFRAVGSNSNVGLPMAVLNLIVGDQLNKFHEKVQSEMTNNDTDKRIAIINILREYIKETKAIRFEGDGYSHEWEVNAEKLGRSNIKDTARALDVYLTEDTKKLYTQYGICTEREIEARHEIMALNYSRKIQIESRIMGDLAYSHVLPTAIAYQNKLITNAQGLAALGLDNTVVKSSIEEISSLIQNVKTSVDEMHSKNEEIGETDDVRERSIKACDEIKGRYFGSIRESVDKLELLIDNDEWPLPKYREMLFLR